MFSLALFDLDGTLSDPLEGIGHSINHALRAHGYDAVPFDVLATCVGPPLDQSFARLTGVSDPDALMSMVLAYRERYLDTGYRENVLYPGIVEALDTLQRAGVTMALCTSKPEPGTRMILSLFGLTDYFAFLSCGDVGVEKWQQIEGLRAAGTVDGNAIMIGDRAVDIEAGRRNGIATGAVTWGYGTRDELSAAKPDLCYAEPADWIASLAPTESRGQPV
ncbi:MAG: HAD hydrolase-like protein [Pseudomonadota bacterium]